MNNRVIKNRRIKLDYSDVQFGSAKGRSNQSHPWLQFLIGGICLVAILVTARAYTVDKPPVTVVSAKRAEIMAQMDKEQALPAVALQQPSPRQAPDVESKKPSNDLIAFISKDRASLTLPALSKPTSQLIPQSIVISNDKAAEAPPAVHNVTDSRTVVDVVKTGDSLSELFERNGVGASTLLRVMDVGPVARHLKRLYPGDKFEFSFDGSNQLDSLTYLIDDENTLLIERDGKTFTAQTVTRLLDKQINTVKGTINSSLFLTAQKAGLSNAMTMEFAGIFGWDVDFALDVREGDSFAVIYETLHRDGKKVRDGKILAAEFTNRGRTFRTAYYKLNGRGQYFSAKGRPLRKTFIRTPVDFARISSRFSLSRKHPILHKIRAHKGVDYAAQKGTPIKSTGDGKVIFAGRKGGYGNTIVIKHGVKYTTLYAHLSRYGKNIRSGKRVRQGQVIGYVGSSGLATGPHLHYEFRLNGVHRNPLTVKFPSASRLPKKHMADFKQQTQPFFSQLVAISPVIQVAEK